MWTCELRGTLSLGVHWKFESVLVAHTMRAHKTSETGPKCDENSSGSLLVSSAQTASSINIARFSLPDSDCYEFFFCATIFDRRIRKRLTSTKFTSEIDYSIFSLMHLNRHDPSVTVGLAFSCFRLLSNNRRTRRSIDSHQTDYTCSCHCHRCGNVIRSRNPSKCKVHAARSVSQYYLRAHAHRTGVRILNRYRHVSRYLLAIF